MGKPVQNKWVINLGNYLSSRPDFRPEDNIKQYTSEYKLLADKRYF
jgi:hypothetical protein